MSLFSTSHIPENYQPSNQPQRSELKQQIEKFLRSAAAQSDKPRLCSRCGAEMKSIDTTFSLLGADSAWNVKVPFCTCAAENTGESSSNGDGKPTDDAGKKKAAA
jgi:hypothetical protein